MADEKITLKPCPYCGGVSELAFKIPVYGAGGCEIKCLTCNATIRDFKFSETHLGENSVSTFVTIESITKCIERTTKAWNRRVSDG